MVYFNEPSATEKCAAPSAAPKGVPGNMEPVVADDGMTEKTRTRAREQLRCPLFYRSLQCYVVDTAGLRGSVYRTLRADVEIFAKCLLQRQKAAKKSHLFLRIFIRLTRFAKRSYEMMNCLHRKHST